MSIESRSNQYGSLFGSWHVQKLLGGGSGGRSAVFQLYRSSSGWQEFCAMKVVSLIEERGRQEAMHPVRREEYSTAARQYMEAAEQEVRLMEQLRSRTNIVDYLDHQFVNWYDENSFGVDLLIRMELLQDLRSELRRGRCFREEEVIAIGRDICRALVICHSKGILHRDIKPENIFFNKDGDYKLGDFGVSRIISSAPSAVASTDIGTVAYAAPEQFRGAYDKRVDIYSLGLVLYELSNGNRLPFASTGYATDTDIQKRLLGNPLPVPCDRRPEGPTAPAVSRLSRIILKACAYRPQDRYASAEEMLRALDALAEGKPEPEEPYVTAPVYRSQDPGSFRLKPEEKPVSEPVHPPNKKKFPVAGVLLVLACVLLLGLGRGKKPIPAPQIPTENEPVIAVSSEATAPPETLAPETEPEETTDPLAILEEGNIFAFGSYEQDGNTHNGPEDIEWIVLEKQEDRILVISRQILDCQSYHRQWDSVTWETCSIRSWLNSTFYNAAFEKEEQERILTTAVHTEPNPKFSISGGRDTEDKLFFLSLGELNRYFYSDDGRMCRATQYALNQNAYEGATGGSWWLLRTPGDKTSKVMSVNSDGSIDHDGGDVTSTRSGVRPVMWLKVRR